MKTDSRTFIEPLESRIAPALLFVNANMATYDDVDGDRVTVKFSKPILTAGNVGNVIVVSGAQLIEIDLSAANGSPAGTGISVAAKLAGKSINAWMDDTLVQAAERALREHDESAQAVR